MTPSANSAPGAEAFFPERGGLPSFRAAAATCKGCHLYEVGTQTVFGEGTSSASIMLVGEQPGDREDLAGKPFIGPAGRLLDDALHAAEIDRAETYVTNVVKHFKWVAKGKRRIHKKPDAQEIIACRPWLEAELDLVKPQVVVALGATAAKAMLGSSFTLTKHRGTFVEWEREPLITATMHPSAILRDPQRRAEGFAALVSDLQLVARQIERA